MREARALAPVVPQHGDAGAGGPGAPVVELGHCTRHPVETIRHARGVVSVTPEDEPALSGAGAAPRMPNGSSLDEKKVSIIQGRESQRCRRKYKYLLMS